MKVWGVRGSWTDGVRGWGGEYLQIQIEEALANSVQKAVERWQKPDVVVVHIAEQLHYHTQSVAASPTRIQEATATSSDH